MARPIRSVIWRPAARATTPRVGVAIAPILGLEAALSAADRDEFTSEVPMAVSSVRAVKD
jgi:hypothetical protein